ncbi:E-selectin [Rhineura floridana]|uniref:E-selectin n=1 Tax=Rhineura floridana TaxID=261503 RepID=UPI002AC7F36D|nr:E-selectin [Rhineura floridana]XP_061441457.1 E-selectin [Rhineura floridana]XP_061441468.1 E-selectin [Rhineura floridana]
MRKAFWSLSVLIYGLLLLKESTCWTYHPSDQNMSYPDAEKWCKTHFTHLVAIQNKEENKYLNVVLRPNPNYYWIGVRKIDSEWRWVGTNKKLTEEAKNWAKGEPNNKGQNQDCVEIYIKRTEDSGKWNDEPCGKKKAALCYTASCKPHSCNGHGECVETINNYTCYCSRGFYGRECEHVITCDPLKEPDHGTLECNHPVKDFSYNSSCHVQCMEGYKSTGLEPVSCTYSGNWSAPTPVCKVAECHKLQKPAHGFLNCSHPYGNFAWNSSCKFGCEEGFTLNGSSRLQCGASKEWDGQAPECEAVKCEVVHHPEKGFVRCSHADTELTYNSTCDFVCKEGYTLRGSPRIQCSSKGHWSEPIPVCEVVECSELKPPVHGFLYCSHATGNFSWNSSCKFACEEGFALKGSSELQCGVYGEWSGQQPECEAVKCEVVGQPERGFMNCSHLDTDPIYNSVCEFSCEEGYTLRGSSKIQCSSKGHWSEPVPICEATQCEILAHPENGFLNCSDPDGHFAYNTICEISCTEGRILNGPHRLQCLASGNWTARLPACEAPHEFVSVAIGATATGASFLSIGLLLIWLIKRFRRKAKKFTPASSCQSLDSEGTFQSSAHLI